MVLHWAGRYDLLVWLLTLGRERRFREKLLVPARLRPGEHVLDVGCGTGDVPGKSTELVGRIAAKLVFLLGEHVYREDLGVLFAQVRICPDSAVRSST